MEALKATFRAPGVLQAALGYYRCDPEPGQSGPALGELQTQISMSPVTVPTLVFHGARDGCMGVELLDGMEALFPDGLRKVVIARRRALRPPGEAGGSES